MNEKCQYCGEVHHPSHVNSSCKMLAQFDAGLDHADADESATDLEERLELASEESDRMESYWTRMVYGDDDALDAQTGMTQDERDNLG